MVMWPAYTRKTRAGGDSNVVFQFPPERPASVRGGVQVLHEQGVVLRPGLGVGHAQQGRGVEGDHGLGLVLQLQRLSADLEDRQGLAGHGEGGGGAERQDHARPEQAPLGAQPPTAGDHLAPVRGLVQATLAPQLMLEVLHGVGDVKPGAVGAGLGQRPIEHLSGGTDERPSDAILLVAGLLAHQHQGSILRSLSRHAMQGVLPKVATAAGDDQGRHLGKAARDGTVVELRWAGCPSRHHRATV